MIRIGKIGKTKEKRNRLNIHVKGKRKLNRKTGGWEGNEGEKEGW